MFLLSSFHGGDPRNVAVRVGPAANGYSLSIDMAPPAPSYSLDALREVFGRASAMTVGIEEELMLLEPSSLKPVALGPGLRRYLGEPWRFHAELSPTQIEIVSRPHTTVSAAIEDLRYSRTAVVDALAGQARLAGLAVHPFGESVSAISPGERYARLERRYGWCLRRAGLAGGLHIHVTVPQADRALAVYNALRGYMPQIAALAASAPFFDDRDTGLASIRPLLADSLPRQGVAPLFPTWEAYANYLTWGVASGAFWDFHELWWECRLHPVFGTIEVRVADAQAEIEDVEAVATVVHCLVRWLASRYDEGELLSAHERIRIAENRWRAAVEGVDGTFVDLDTGTQVFARRLVAGLLADLGPHAATDREQRSLQGAQRMLDAPHPHRQRATAARSGLMGLVAAVADATEAVADLGEAAS